MSNPPSKSGLPYSYQPEAYIRPGANLSVFVWLVLLGLPVLLLLLIYAKLDDQPQAPAQPTSHMERPAHH